MSKLPVEYLRHILDEINYLHEEIYQYGENRFMYDPTFQRAASRSLEIIGEAVKQIPADFRKRYPKIDWKGLAGLRDKLIHHYFGVDYAIVWDIIKNELPLFKKQITEIIRIDSTK
ncbi:hypothetical protein A2781_05110 [Candidatus Gottesmanbacteria bacterium RIFCSPHIGHO2_01_FULL_42_27]|nr:MAG: hypothetical protein A2781_05110 [Candidatus Gottesmanbacteria bacterium RIFCSPHIGHO2_01_FULL_42_27]